MFFFSSWIHSSFGCMNGQLLPSMPIPTKFSASSWSFTGFGELTCKLSKLSARHRRKERRKIKTRGSLAHKILATKQKRSPPSATGTPKTMDGPLSICVELDDVCHVKCEDSTCALFYHAYNHHFHYILCAYMLLQVFPLQFWSYLLAWHTQSWCNSATPMGSCDLVILPDQHWYWPEPYGDSLWELHW